MNNFMPTKIEKDYLSSLLHDIHNDKSLDVILNEDRITNIKESLSFFDELNIELHDVEDINCRFIKVSDIDVLIDPSYVRSRLIRQIYACDQHISKIIIGNSDKDIAYGSYLHEIVHTQVHKYGYIPQVKEDYNVEVLPMFIELLYALKNDNSNILLRRIHALQCYIPDYLLYFEDDSEVSEEDKNKSERYIKSFLQAIHLINKYRKLEDINKKEFISKLNEVFIGHITVEDLLRDYNVKYKNSAYDLKELKRSI